MKDINITKWIRENGDFDHQDWEHVPDQPGFVRPVRQRKYRELARHLYKAVRHFDLEDEDFMSCDDRSWDAELADTDMPKNIFWKVYAYPGGNEGHRVEVDVFDSDKRTSQNLGSVKTFGGFDRALEIAAIISKLVWHPSNPVPKPSEAPEASEAV